MPKVICPKAGNCRVVDADGCNHKTPHKTTSNCGCFCSTHRDILICRPCQQLIYMATPYSHNDRCVRLDRYSAACRVAADLIQKGHLVFSPIAHSHPITMRGGLPLGFDYWKAFDLHMLRLCDKVIVVKMTGWKESIGVQAEIEEAIRLGMVVEYMEATAGNN